MTTDNKLKTIELNQSIKETFHWRDVFCRDVWDLFSNTKSGHLGEWMFSVPEFEDDDVKGASYWNRCIEESNDYYPYQNEILMIENFQHEISRLVDDSKMVVEFGPGSKEAVINKSIPMLKHVQNLEEYIAIDCCKEFLKETADLIRHYLPNVKYHPFHCDFADIRITNGDFIAFSFGTTISNVEGSPYKVFDIKKFVEQLKLFRNTLVADSLFFISQDTNQNSESMHNSYYHPLQQKHCKNIM